MITVISIKEIIPVAGGIRESTVASCFLFCHIRFLNKKYMMKGKKKSNPHAHRVVTAIAVWLLSGFAITAR